MSQFKVGDMVECADPDTDYPGGVTLHAGHVYTVTEVTANCVGVDGSRPYFSWRFRKWSNRTFKSVGRLIKAERNRQDAKFGPYGSAPQKSPFELMSVLVEEVGELAQALNDGDAAHAHEELVQVAAVAVAWLEAYEAGHHKVLG